MVGKNWLWLGIFISLGVSAAIGAPAAVHPSTGEPLIVTCLKGTPEVLDGDLSDWNLEAMTPAVLDSASQISSGATTWTGPSDLSAKFYTMWDDQKVYIGVIVKDDVISATKTNGDIWNADCVEVFFGTTNTAPTGTHTQHYQFGFNVNQQKWNWCNMDSAGQSLPDYVQVASRRTADGYVCEAAIEYGRILDLTWTPGSILGFHPAMDDTDATDRELQMTWTGREAHDQSLGFGYLILSAEPAVAKELSRSPIPAVKTTDVPIDSTFSWTAGIYAATHDVYFGTVFADVNNASRQDPRGVLVSKGQTAAQFQPAAIAYGQTYYWRVDEVGADGTIYRGQVWSFAAEPYGYPIKPIKATASSSLTAAMGPDKTIDGSGLDSLDQHSVSAMQMWLSKKGQSPVWIQYEFDAVYKLHEMWVWNSNQEVEPITGFGAKEVSIQYSTDGTTWQTLAGVPEFNDAPGDANYVHNTTVSFGGVQAKFVKLNIATNWADGTKQAGLSEVRFFYAPMKAFKPSPASGAGDVALDAVLGWRPGREAAKHQVILSSDAASVAKNTPVVASGASHSLALQSLGLEYGRTYTWKVNEVNDAAATTLWEGDTWTFTTIGYAVVDDFEKYNDLCNRLFFSWVDGFGYSASPDCSVTASTGNSTGSTVGNASAPFADQTITHGGRQSMPMWFDNTKSPFYSESQREWQTPQSWTGGGANTLSVWVRGDAASFVETAPGAITMNGTGTDVWEAADQFRFAYKALKGNGSIVAKVESVSNTHEWAKAGVMIRESTAPGSKHAFLAATPTATHGISYQRRVDTDVATNLATDAADTPLPQWVKLTRNGSTFTAQYSSNGTTWTDVVVSPAVSITMANDVLIGLAVTSHLANSVCAARFSGVSTTGGVSGTWQIAEIGATQVGGNTPENFYVAVQDSTGKTKAVSNPSSSVIATGAWEQWNIPLSEFTSAGINVGSIKKVMIGVGDRNSPKAGGTGKVNIDDIQLTRK
jgi:regulation of enolase protein 1 (concanavalin A-like superfamily)